MGDIIIVWSGVARLRHSRKFLKVKKYMLWEWRADGLVDAAEVMLLAGDVVRVPAGKAIPSPASATHRWFISSSDR